MGNLVLANQPYASADPRKTTERKTSVIADDYDDDDDAHGAKRCYQAGDSHELD